MKPTDRAFAEHSFVPRSRLATAALRRYTHGAAPPLVRGSMAPAPWLGLLAGLRRAWQGDVGTGDPERGVRPRGWERAAARRRLALVLL
ncbi:MAG: hypothetical protein KF683_05695, partial [Rubrivivax sp.]|nr:hypothetical protein [Rubrivivax sp.]